MMDLPHDDALSDGSLANRGHAPRRSLYRGQRGGRTIQLLRHAGILVVFMTQYLMGRDGSLAVMGKADAMEYYHWFLSAVYFFPVLGALCSDVWLGKYRTILYVSLIYCLGHLALSLDETRLGLAVGLTLIAVGSGGIKPCVSANVGDQFGQSNRHFWKRYLAGSIFRSTLARCFRRC